MLAFVVQLRDVPPGAHPHFVGRVEHVTSGEAARFAAPEQLLAFLLRVLRTVSRASLETPPAGCPGDSLTQRRPQ